MCKYTDHSEVGIPRTEEHGTVMTDRNCGEVPVRKHGSQHTYRQTQIQVWEV